MPGSSAAGIYLSVELWGNGGLCSLSKTSERWILFSKIHFFTENNSIFWNFGDPRWRFTEATILTGKSTPETIPKSRFGELGRDVWGSAEKIQAQNSVKLWKITISCQWSALGQPWAPVPCAEHIPSPGDPWMSSAAPGCQSRLRSVNLASTSSSAGVKQIPPRGDFHGQVPSRPFQTPQDSRKDPLDTFPTSASHEIQGIPTPGWAAPTSLCGK